VNALVVGHAEPAAALTSALSDRGVEAELYAPPSPAGDRAVAELATTLVELEERLAAEPPALVVAVGLGDAPLAVAVTAAKLTIPLVAWIEDANGAATDVEEAEQRILRTLADLDAGPVGDGVAAFEAAERIASWADRVFR
jgi:hypothetical protein